MMSLAMPLVVMATGNWSSGAICEGVDPNLPASQMLRGRHLRVGDMLWRPYAAPDNPDHPTGWSGLNIDLLDGFSADFGFTYEIVDVGSPVNAETWTDLMLRSLPDLDLLASFWVNGPDRAEHAMFLYGHIDLSAVLVSRWEHSAVADWDQWTQSFFRFLHPFTSHLWFAIAALLFFSGLVDFLIERQIHKSDARLTASLYEYSAGTIWGGFEYPLSKVSAVYQILVGFMMLIFVSSYTANLAAFITTSARSTRSVSSLDQATIDQISLCRGEGEWTKKLERIYPRLHFALTSSDQHLLADTTAGGDGCDGLVTTRNQYDHYKTDEIYCSLDIAQNIFPTVGGWVTNKRSWCVEMAISKALADLDYSGKLSRHYSRYVQPAPCGSWYAENGRLGARRRLQPSSPRPSDEKKSAARRLEASRSLEQADPEGGGGDSNVTQLDLVDFIGLFLIWASVTVAFLAWSYRPAKIRELLAKLIKETKSVSRRASHRVSASTSRRLRRVVRRLNRRKGLQRRDLEMSISEAPQHERPRAERPRSAAEIMHRMEIDAFGESAHDYEFDNESSMIREVLRRSVLLKLQLDKLGPIGGDCDRSSANGQGKDDETQIDRLARDAYTRVLQCLDSRHQSARPCSDG